MGSEMCIRDRPGNNRDDDDESKAHPPLLGDDSPRPLRRLNQVGGGHSLFIVIHIYTHRGGVCVICFSQKEQDKALSKSLAMTLGLLKQIGATLVDIQDIMWKNIRIMTTRGETVAALQEASAELALSSQVFLSQQPTLKQPMVIAVWLCEAISLWRRFLIECRRTCCKGRLFRHEKETHLA